MAEAQAASLKERQRLQVKAAIQLVADGRYPAVMVANLLDARLVVRDLIPQARRRGVDVTLPAAAAGSGCDVEVRRR